VLAARKTYHRMNDEVSRSLDVEAFQDDTIFEQVRFVDFYRYCDVELDEVLAYLRREVPWVRPEDTGRSTNCLINDAGIYVHKRERGFHNYALPYSWDVRLGHKDRDAALAELDDTIDEAHVRSILAQVGYDPDQAAESTSTTTLEAFYVPRGETSPEDLRRQLAEHLPAPLIPSRFHPVESLPLTPNGKVDTAALSELAGDGRTRTPYRAPEGPVEEFLVELWQDEFAWQENHATRRIGANDHFFELGGTSLAALQVMLRLCQEFVLDLPLDALFSHPTLAQLARYAEDRILAEDAELGEGG
jgi:acyl carrier protein